MERSLLYVRRLGHNGEFGLGRWAHDDRGLRFNLVHGWVVSKLVLREIALTELDVGDTLVFPDGLVSNAAEVLNDHCTLLFDLALAPFSK